MTKELIVRNGSWEKRPCLDLPGNSLVHRTHGAQNLVQGSAPGTAIDNHSVEKDSVAKGALSVSVSGH